ncbi:hypothetical protein O181_041832 [Austropuccinia psidii MF-1]|uniref:Uncharacterized protein n=1 Tax=Austropuccinia psidii MF-1 TaxID=1389203 RepID=A0A9Q3DHG0_9BASI|nr:hypothetical protein [Austropuccinia psidii MF-1]
MAAPSPAINQPVNHSNLSTSTPIDPSNPFNHLLNQTHLFLSQLHQQQISSSNLVQGSINNQSLSHSQSNLNPDRNFKFNQLNQFFNSLTQIWSQFLNLPFNSSSINQSDQLACCLIEILHVIKLDPPTSSLIDLFKIDLIQDWWNAKLFDRFLNKNKNNSIIPSNQISKLLIELLTDRLIKFKTSNDSFHKILISKLLEFYSQDIIIQESNSNQMISRQILITWAKAEPKDFFNSLHQFIFKISNQKPSSLSILIDSITSLPFSIHNIRSTNLLPSLILSIIHQDKDNQSSPQTIKLTIDSLLIILPRIPVLIALFNQLDSIESNLINLPHTIDQLDSNPNYSVDSQLIHLSAFNLFNFLYGLSPCNLMDFIRSPIDSIKSFQSQTFDDDDLHHHYQLYTSLEEFCHRAEELIEVTYLKQAILPLLEHHKLSEKLVLMNSISERKEISNQLKLCEPAELIEKCEKNLFIVKEVEKENDSSDELEKVFDWFSERVMNIELANDSNNEKTNEEQSQEQIKSLENQIMMLKSQLKVERYLKLQHLQQMGTLHKQKVLAGGLEAENQNLHTINRELRKKVEQYERNLDNSRTSNERRKTNQQSYQELIKERTNKNREEKLRLVEENNECQAKLEELNKVVMNKCSDLKTAQTEAHYLRNELKLLQPKLESNEELESKNERLTKALLTWDDDLRRFRESRKQIDVLRAEWKRFESLAASAQIENATLKDKLKIHLEIINRLETENKFLKETNKKNFNQIESAKGNVDEGHEISFKNSNMSTSKRNCLITELKKTIEKLEDENIQLKSIFAESSS